MSALKYQRQTMLTAIMLELAMAENIRVCKSTHYGYFKYGYFKSPEVSALWARNNLIM